MSAASPLTGARHAVTRLREEARSLSAREALEDTLAAVGENKLLAYASALSFHVFFSLIPIVLFGLGLLGGLGLQETWSAQLAPEVMAAVSAPAFRIIDDTVSRVLEERQLFWITFGAAIAVWKTSSAVRTVMDALDRVYDCEDVRSMRRRIAVSVVLASAVTALVLGAAAMVQLGPAGLAAAGLDGGAAGELLAALRWPLAVMMLLATVAVLVRYAPARTRPIGWVTFGSLLAVATWVVTSLAFGWYLTAVADYGSIFGNLATVIVVLQYLYLSAVAFFVGTQIDALARRRVEAGSGRR